MRIPEMDTTTWQQQIKDQLKQTKASYMTLQEIADTFQADMQQEPVQPGDLLLSADRDGWKPVMIEGISSEQPGAYRFIVRSACSYAIHAFLSGSNEAIVDDDADLAIAIPVSEITLAQLKRLRIPRFVKEAAELFDPSAVIRMTPGQLSETKRKLEEMASASVNTIAGGAAMASTAALLPGLVGSAIAFIAGAGLTAVGVKGIKALFSKKKNSDFQHTKESSDKEAYEKKIAELEKQLEESGLMAAIASERRFEEQMSTFMAEMRSRLDRMEQKMDQVLSAVTGIQRELDAIRSTDRDVEEKLLLIHSLLERKLDAVTAELKDDLHAYVELLERSMLNWGKLDPLSKDMLPLAEYLYDRLSPIQDVDFSPVILQYCRTLENEILKKIFISFSLYLYDAYPMLDGFFAADYRLEVTAKFAKACRAQKGKPPEQIKYTFGEMTHVIRAALGQHGKQSPLLKEFVVFIGNRAETSFILSHDFISRMKYIVDNFRNKCAHPYKLGADAADACKKRLPREIDELLGNLS